MRYGTRASDTPLGMPTRASPIAPVELVSEVGVVRPIVEINSDLIEG